MMVDVNGGVTVTEAILGRSSAKKFSERLPTRAEVEELLRAAVRAPDHGLLAPWRFLVLAGDARGVLGDAMKAALLERMPEADSDTQERERSKAFRSPVLIVVAAKSVDHPKVPEIEQLVAVGAAVQNMWLRARELGLGMAWKTGSHAYHPGVKAALGLGAEDHLIGFLHVGEAISLAPVRAAEFESKTAWWGVLPA
jgi:nitroreductase